MNGGLGGNRRRPRRYDNYLLPWVAGELAYWNKLAGGEPLLVKPIGKPFARALAGDRRGRGMGRLGALCAVGDGLLRASWVKWRS